MNINIVMVYIYTVHQEIFRILLVYWYWWCIYILRISVLIIHGIQHWSFTKNLIFWPNLSLIHFLSHPRYLNDFQELKLKNNQLLHLEFTLKPCLYSKEKIYGGGFPHYPKELECWRGNTKLEILELHL